MYKLGSCIDKFLVSLSLKKIVLVASLEEKLLLDLLLWLALALIQIRILVRAKLKSITIMLGGGILTLCHTICDKCFNAEI